MATMYISKITPLGSSTTYNIKDLEAIQSIATGDSNGQIKITPRSGNTYNVNVKNTVTFTKNTNVTVAGTSKDTYKYDQSAIFAPNGLIMGGTAAAAGLVTRGICGISTPNATTGAADKDNLYINFDGTTTYNANRQLVLQAGTVGDHYGNNVYQYAAVRGDAMKAWVEAKGYITSFTDTLVKQTAKTNDANYKILLGANTNPTSGLAYEAAYDSNITINPSTHTITATTFSGNATSATGFASAKSIALTGDITGSATGGNGSNNWSIATTIGTGKVTNAMLAGSIANNKLANSKVTIAGNDVSLGGSLTADTLRSSLGLSNAMHFIGITSTTLSDGATTDTLTAKTTGSLTKTTGFIAGDVVIDTNSNYEYVWTGTAWERLGPDGSYKITQTAYTDSTGTAETTTATRFVYSVSQDANGVVSFKTRPLPTYNNYSLPLAASGTRGGIQIGYSESGTNYAVKLSSEKAYVTVPWTDTKVTSVDNHYAPAANSDSELTASLSGTAGAYAVNTEYTVLTGIKAQRDAKGHVTGLTYTAQKIKDTNTTYTFDGTYNASTNKAATVSTVTNAINALDVSNIFGFGVGKTLKTLTETDGKIAATFQDISITKSQVTDFPTDVSTFTNDAGYLTSFTETDPTVPSWAKASSKPSYTASEVGLGNVTNAAQITKSTFTKAYQVMYSTAASTPAVLDANTTATKKFLRMTGTGSAGAAPAWDTVTKSDVGLGNVENTKLSTWAGSSNITTIGTLSSGTVPWARLSGVPAGASKEGTVTSITPGNGLLNGTGTSAITTSGTLNLNYGSSASAVSTTAAAGTANTVSRSDHVHSIALATGDANGQVKIAGTNINVKGLGSAAYTESNAYAASSHTHYWANVETTSAAAYNTAPEMAALKLNGNTSASAASTSNVTLVYDTTSQALNFVFA